MGRTAEAVEMIFTKLLTCHFTTSTAVVIFICPAGAVTLRTTAVGVFGDRAFAVAGPCAWNNLPDFITDCTSSRAFKRYLKT